MNHVSVNGLQPYEILGLHKGASADEARGAMKLLAKIIHPDILPRGGGLFAIVKAAAEAMADAGGQWPVQATPWRPAPPSRPRTPQAPPAPRPAPRNSGGWKSNAKGNWSRKQSREWVTVYLKNGEWRWVGPGLNGPEYGPDAFDTAEAAMADADTFFGD